MIRARRERRVDVVRAQPDGQVIVIDEVQRTSALLSGVGRKAVEGYLGVLENLLLSFRLPRFRKRAARATVARAKFYLFDCAVFRWLRTSGPLDRREEIAGACVCRLRRSHRLRSCAALVR